MAAEATEVTLETDQATIYMLRKCASSTQWIFKLMFMVSSNWNDCIDLDFKKKMFGNFLKEDLEGFLPDRNRIPSRV